jgi:5-oxoprolinase (ATP-hydrolysing)
MKAVLIHPLRCRRHDLSAYGIRRAPSSAKERGAALESGELDQALDAMAVELHANFAVEVLEETINRPSAGCTSAMTAPTPRLRRACNLGREEAAKAEFEAAHKAQFGFVIPGQAPITVEAVEVEHDGGSPRDDGRSDAKARRRDAACDRSVRFYRRATRREAAVFDREALRAGDRVKGPASSSSPTRPSLSSPAGRRRLTAIATHPDATRHEAMARTSAIGTDAGRPGDAGGVQQPLHEHRRADGRHAAEHRHSVNIKERLDFSCAVFDAERRAGRQRAAHAGAPGLHGPRAWRRSSG